MKVIYCTASTCKHNSGFSHECTRDGKGNIAVIHIGEKEICGEKKPFAVCEDYEEREDEDD